MRQAIDKLECMIADPRQGLPEPIFRFAARIVPMVNVDLLVRDISKGTLLVWRDDDLFHGWHIPGGIVRYQETLSQRVERTSLKELGCPVIFDSKPSAFHEFILPQFRERAHFISFLYFCRLNGEIPPSLCYENGIPQNGQCAWFRRTPKDFLEVQKCYIPYIEGDILCPTN